MIRTEDTFGDEPKILRRKSDLEVILMITECPQKIHFNDVRRKSDLEVILMIRTEDEKAIRYEMKIRRPKKRSRSHFNDTNRRYYVRKSDLEVILMIRTKIRRTIWKSF